MPVLLCSHLVKFPALHINMSVDITIVSVLLMQPVLGIDCFMIVFLVYWDFQSFCFFSDTGTVIEDAAFYDCVPHYTLISAWCPAMFFHDRLSGCKEILLWWEMVDADIDKSKCYKLVANYVGLPKWWREYSW